MGMLTLNMKIFVLLHLLFSANAFSFDEKDLSIDLLSSTNIAAI